MVKFLGVQIDEKLNWDGQIENIGKKIKRGYFAICQIRKQVDIKALLLIFHALIQPHIAYNILLWGDCTEVERIFILQKKAMRLIFNIKNMESCRNYLNRNVLCG